MNCNAKVTTATETDEVVWSGAANQPWTHVVPDGEAVVRRGDRLVRVDLHPLTCKLDADHEDDWHVSSAHEWHDKAMGATPHTPPADYELSKAERVRMMRSPVTPPPPVCSTCGGSGVWTDGVHDDACPDCKDDDYAPGERPADVCPDCGAALVGDPIEGFPPHVTCPSCGGTGDRPAVTDAEVEAAKQVLMAPPGTYDDVRFRARAALEAAAAARQEAE